MKKPIKKAMTLLEVMIVIFIIGIIGSVIGYNMRGSLDEGKAFKTQEAARKMYEILELEEARGNPVNSDFSNIASVLQGSGLIRKPSDIMKDGWGNAFDFYFDDEQRLRFSSTKYNEYLQKKGKTADYPWQDDN